MSSNEADLLVLRPDAQRLLDRELAENEMQRVLGTEQGLLSNALFRGVALLNSLGNTVPSTWMRDSTAALLWQYLEELDALDVLLRAGALGPSEVVARSMLEIAFQSLFLIQTNDERFAQAYSVDRIRRNAVGFEKLVVGSEAKRELIVEAKRTWMGDSGYWKRMPDTKVEAANLRGGLTAGASATINEEFERLGPNANWYSVFGGPRDLIELARAIGMDQWHRMLYAPWSDRVHGRASNKVFVLDKHGTPFMNILRDTNSWSTYLAIPHVITVRVFRGITERFAPDELGDFSDWEASSQQLLRECLIRNGLDPRTRSEL
jgi:hypothetical protein